MRDDGMGKNPTPPYARYLVHIIRPFPNFDFFFIKSLRQRATQLLCLSPGDRVLDVGCGWGGSFPYLVKAVGPTGEIIGVEISPEIALNARNRIRINDWSNVRVLQEPAESAELIGEFDGLLLFAAQDVLTSPRALANLFSHLKVGARVVVFSAKLTNRASGAPFNSLLRTMFSRLSFASSTPIDYAPWRLLREYVQDFSVNEYMLGLVFLAWGTAKKWSRAAQ
jgi:ubiquinone/menaquinone biosynthesis C-methylase UbiE